ncbi:FecR family protein [Sphingobacterium sp. HJSM2_6]|uniref:FecR family protein n=1 Tax=Sphingobacterium sp. HJSM2_6 TaxID=3366264 RepID=UPI003BD20D21
MKDPHQQEAQNLLRRYEEGTCSEEELVLLEQWYNNLNLSKSELSEKEMIADLVDLLNRLNQISNRTSYFPFKKLISAAALLFCVCVIGFVWKNQLKKQEIEKSKLLAESINPGSSQAILTLEDGKEYVLDKKESEIINYGDRITYRNGKAIYQNEKVQLVTLRTPKAGQYQTTLPDGTKVWLNAASSISYPTRFEDHIRKISVKGEVYLEVIKNPEKPFIVLLPNQRIEVLGTKFNISSYENEDIVATTLVEGSLRITENKTKKQVLLKPGEQALVANDSKIAVKRIAAEDYTQWKDGIYLINNETLDQFGKKIERWYHVEVEMGDFKAIRLSAIMRRNIQLSEILSAITMKTHVKFIIKGRRIVAIK